MEGKKRTLFAAAISCIILAAVLYSFFLSIFAKTDKITLADPDANPSATFDPDATGAQGGILVEVTPATVQSIIGSMTRLDSYSRSITVRYYWGEAETQSGTVTAQVQADSGWVRCDTTLPDGTTEHSIVGNGSLWYWYDSDTYFHTAGSANADADLMEHIPTYEDVLSLSQRSIQDTAYLQRSGIPCIYIEAELPQSGYVARYWISLDSGLLIAAEQDEDGELVYSMQADNLVSPLSSMSAPFVLPDGQVLFSSSLPGQRAA